MRVSVSPEGSQHEIVALCFIYHIVPLHFAAHREAAPIALEESEEFCVRIALVEQNQALRDNLQFSFRRWMCPIACALSIH